MTGLRLTLLGGFAANLEATGPLTMPMRRAQALLAYLAVPPGQTHPREKLAALLWGDLPREEARARLRHTLFAIRRALGDASALRMDSDTVTLEPAALTVDVAEFERLAASRDRARLEDAAALYRGELLAGLAGREAPFEDWLTAQRERLREIALEALARLLRLQAEAGEFEAAVQTGLRILELDPMQEVVHRALMRLYRDLGRRGAALRQYQQCVAVLQRELGVEPDEDTQRVYREIVRTPTGASSSIETRGIDAKMPRAHPTTVTAAPAGETPLVGRETELGQLRAALESAAAGAGRMLIVSGEAGAGKSRLVAELAAEAARRDMLVVIGRSHATERILPFSPWVEALRRSLVVEVTARGTTLRKSTMAELGQLVPEFGEPTPAARADAEGWRRLFDGVADLLGAVSQDRPLVVVLEDVHWADDMSIRLLAFVAWRVARWPALVIATVRDEELEDAQVLRGMLGELANESHVVHVQLGPLLEADIRTLTELLSPRVAASDRRRLVEQAWRTSQGNPLVAVETVRALRARPADAAETKLPLPERVRDLVRERFGRLGSRARDLLSVAAVVGRDFEFALLGRAAGIDDDAAAAGVEELVRRRVLHEVGERFDFTHDRIREVAVADILAPRRRLLHRRIGEALEVLNQANLEPHLAALARHFREAEVWDKAVTYLLRAGIGAWQRSAFLEGRALLDEAVRVLEYLPATPESIEQAVDIRLSLHRCLYPVGAFALAHEHLTAAEAAAATLDDARRKARVAVYLSEMHRSMGNHEVAARYASDGLELATKAGDAMLEVEATFQSGVICMFRGEPREAIVRFEAGIRRGEDWPLARRAGYPYLLCVCRLARVLASLGEFATARAWGERALEIAEATGHPFSIACACFDLGHVGVEQGDVSFAIPYLERSLRIADEHHLKVFHPLLAACGGHALALAGRRDEAATLLDLVLEEPPTQIRNAPVSFAFAQAAAGLRSLGNLEAALVIANRAVELARTRRERLYEANALVQLAAVAASKAPPRWDDAERCYAEALAIAEPVGARPRVAECHLGLGRVHAARGDRDRARDHLARAASLFRDMAMTSGIASAERALGGLA